MKKLIVYHGDSPVYVEGFSKDCKRSREGSVHILPGKPLTVTDGEFDHIKEKYSWMKVKIIAEVQAKKSEEKGGATKAVESKETKAKETPKPEAKGETTSSETKSSWKKKKK